MTSTLQINYNYYQLIFQEWLSEVLLEKKLDIFQYQRKLITAPFEADGAVIVLVSAMIQRPITLVTQKGNWNSNNNDVHDVVMAYMGHNKYHPTEVGKYYFIHSSFITLK